MKINLKGMDEDIKHMVESVAYAVELHRLHPDLAGVPAFSTNAQEIVRLLVAGFPKPDQISAGPDGLPDYLQLMAHEAVNVNDRRHRDEMRDRVCSVLLHGGALEAPERAWLIYVLGNIQDLPRDSKIGPPIKSDEKNELLLGLVGFINDDEQRYPEKNRGYVERRLKRAASKLAKSYESIRAVYYSKQFKSIRQNLEKRRNYRT